MISIFQAILPGSSSGWRKRRFKAIAAVAFVLLLFGVGAVACPPSLSSGPELSVIRVTDWTEIHQPRLFLLPREMDRTGSSASGEGPRWKSKYASLVAYVDGLGAVAGLNEEGLGGHVLYLDARHDSSGERPPSSKLPKLEAQRLLQYLLDNAARTDEAVELLQMSRLLPVVAGERRARLQLALKDRFGVSRVVEYNGDAPEFMGELRYRMIDLPLRGEVVELSPEVRKLYDALEKVPAIAYNIAPLFEGPEEYQFSLDLKAPGTPGSPRFVIFINRTIATVEFADFELTPGSSVMELDPATITLSGNPRGLFKPSSAP